MGTEDWIETPDDPRLDALCQQLASRADHWDLEGSWPRESLALCGKYGVFRWFVPAEWGGLGWSEDDVVRGYLRLGQACLTTTFIITQRTGACRRILSSENEPLKAQLLPALVSGESFATVGISHLTTSRRHLARPAMTARETTDGFILDGFSPWVTGGRYAETIVTGATLEDGRQLLAAMPTDLPGVEPGESAQLVGLSASHTGPVHCHSVAVPVGSVLAGPVEDVMSHGVGARTGGLETSTLAAGLAAGAIEFLEGEAVARNDLKIPAASLRDEQQQLASDLLSQATGRAACSTEQIRIRANSLALRSAQAALAAAKGTGYVRGHPAGRWCREALFFLVWSCPQPVLSANLCELAGIEG